MSELSGVPSTAVMRSRSASAPSAGWPFLIACTSSRGVTLSPSASSATAAAVSWEETISTWPSCSASSALWLSG